MTDFLALSRAPIKDLPDTPKTLLTTRGGSDAAEAMAQHIRENFGWNVVVPQYQ